MPVIRRAWGVLVRVLLHVRPRGAGHADLPARAQDQAVPELLEASALQVWEPVQL